MSPKPKITLATFGVLIAFLGWAIREWIAATELTASLAVASDQRHTIETDLDRLRRRIDELEKSRGGLERDLNAVRLKAGGLAGIRGEKSPTPAPGPVREALINDPQFQNLVLAARRASWAATYGPLFERLGLSAEQIERFKDALLKSEEVKMDLSALHDQQALATNDPVAARLDAQNSAELEQAQKALLGEAGYRQLKDYERSLPARKAVDDFAGAMALAGAPLTSDQAERLTQVVAQTSPELHEGGSVQSINWTKVLTPATAILSNAQAEIIRRASAPDEYLQKIQTLAQSPR